MSERKCKSICNLPNESIFGEASVRISEAKAALPVFCGTIVYSADLTQLSFRRFCSRPSSAGRVLQQPLGLEHGTVELRFPLHRARVGARG